MTSTVSKNRAALLLIAGIPVIIILAATWLWYYVASGRIDLVGMLGTANQGHLLQPPVSVVELGTSDAAGIDFDPLAVEKPVWRILVPGGLACDEACEQVLYYTRQIHIAMGKYQNRIERVYLADARLLEAGQPGNTSMAQLQEDYAGLKVLYTSAASLEALRGAAGDAPDPAYFVVDPAGWSILSYPKDADGKDVMADLKFLLKNSNG